MLRLQLSRFCLFLGRDSTRFARSGARSGLVPPPLPVSDAPCSCCAVRLPNEDSQDPPPKTDKHWRRLAPVRYSSPCWCVLPSESPCPPNTVWETMVVYHALSFFFFLFFLVIMRSVSVPRVAGQCPPPHSPTHPPTPMLRNAGMAPFSRIGRGREREKDGEREQRGGFFLVLHVSVRTMA